MGSISADTNAAPVNAKESTFLISCRPPCELDAAKFGFEAPKKKLVCDCYCRSVFQKLTDSDLEYFKNNGRYSTSTLKAVEIAFQRCFIGNNR